MSDCFVLYLLLTCMKKKTSGADKFTNNNMGKGQEVAKSLEHVPEQDVLEYEEQEQHAPVQTM